jgi:hypothetical protein
MKTTKNLMLVMRNGSIEITSDNCYLFRPSFVRHNEVCRCMAAITFADFLSEVVEVNKLK